MVNTSIALNMIRGTYLVGQDTTAGTVSNTTTETEVLTFDIPAGTVTNGIIIKAWINNTFDFDSGDVLTWRIKTGTDGAETVKRSILIEENDEFPDITTNDYSSDDIFDFQGQNAGLSALEYIEDTLDWSVAQTVSITAQYSAADTRNEARGIYLQIIGY